MTPPIDRAFVRLAHGLSHFRTAGADDGLPPLLMLHGGPGSSGSLVPLIGALAADRRVIAPDTPGCGASEPLATAAPTVPDYATAVGTLLDRLAIGQVDVYGHHTGAQIGCELAIAQPSRVRRMVLDGAALFPAALRAEFLQRYAPAIEPVADGSHLARLWDFADQLTRHFPHYRRDAAHRIEPAAPLPPATVTGIVAEVMQAWPTWHLAYGAAFTHDLSARLPLVPVPTLVLRVGGDPLSGYAEQAARLLPVGAMADVSRAGRGDSIQSFLEH